MPITAVDLFCGAGGLTSGLEQAGVNVVAGIDMDTSCRWAFDNNTNADFIEGDIKNISANEVSALFPEGTIKLLAGCAPCQPFSSYGRTRKNEDDRWSLLFEFTRLVQGVLPELVTMENVPGLIGHKVFVSFVSTLEGLGYNVSYKVLRCEEYGLPQTRRRLILIASLLGEIGIPKPTHNQPVTVRDTIGHLPEIGINQPNNIDRFHITAGLSDLNQERIRASLPGGTWRDWPEHLVADCHKADSGKSYPSVYGRMSWGQPSPTMTTQCYGFGNGRFGHPEQDRAISLREAAILQSFPENWQFISPNDTLQVSAVGRMIGNAVPPLLGRLIGEVFVEHEGGAENA